MCTICHFCDSSCLWKPKANTEPTYVLPTLYCSRCRKYMCGLCCEGFVKEMENTSFIDDRFWKTDPVFSTIISGIRTNCVQYSDFKLPCCENWENIQMYISNDYSDILCNQNLEGLRDEILLC